MMIHRPALLVLAAIFLAASAGSSPAQDTDTLFREAVRLYRKSEYRAALDKVAEIHATAPHRAMVDDANLHNFKGSCLVALRYFQHARREFEKAVAIEPDSFDMQYNLAELDFLQEHFAEARPRFASLRETDRGKLYSEFLEFKIAMCRLMESERGDDEALASALTDRGTDTAFHLFLEAAMALRKGETDDAQVTLLLAKEMIEPDNYALHLDALIECGLVDPPALARGEAEELHSAGRRPASLGFDRTEPVVEPEPKPAENPAEVESESPAPAVDR